MNHFQSGFRLGCGTEMTLVAFVDNLSLKVYKSHDSLLLFPAAFDTVDYVLLLGCLETEVDIRAYALEWFKSFLRYQSKGCIQC